MFRVISSQANLNMLLGKKQIHGVGAVPSTVHQNLFFWNKDGKFEIVEVDQSSYGIYAAFADESDQALVAAVPFEVDYSFYLNNKSGEDIDKFFCWDSTIRFLLINKVS